MIHFLVDTAEGRIGVLDGCRRDRSGSPIALIVACGWFGRRRLEVPVEEAVRVDHRRRRIVLVPGVAQRRRRVLLRPPGCSKGGWSAVPETAVLCGIGGGAADDAVLDVAAGLARESGLPLLLVPFGEGALAAETRAALVDAMLSLTVSGCDVRRDPGDSPVSDLNELARTYGARYAVVPSASGHEGPCPIVLVPSRPPGIVNADIDR